MCRCPWSASNGELYRVYHDEEWGVPVYDDRTHFEFLVLESAQAGLSWITVLKKRENYRRAYSGFDPAVVAGFSDEAKEGLMKNSGIIRNKAKIESSIVNAGVFLKTAEEYGSFSAYIWSFVDKKPIVNGFEKESEIPASTLLSEKIAKDMKKRGFKFLGPIIMYSHMQATGIVNDHLQSCFRFEEIIKNYSVLPE